MVNKEEHEELIINRHDKRIISELFYITKSDVECLQDCPCINKMLEALARELIEIRRRVKMTKKEIIQNTEPFAYYSGYGGIELHHIEYGVDDYVYFVAGAWTANKSYHKSKIYFNSNGDSYIKFNGNRIPLGECIRMN